MRALKFRFCSTILLTSLLILAAIVNALKSFRFTAKYTETHDQSWPKVAADSESSIMKSTEASGGSTGHAVHDPDYSPAALSGRALSFSNTSDLAMFLVEQERRKRHIATVCEEKNPSSIYHPLLLVYDSKNSLTYCPIYKAASISWSVLLLQMAGVTKSDDVNLQVLLKKVFPRISRHTEYEMSRDTTKFFAVRHPLDRLVSAYRDKYQNANKVWYYINFGQEMVRMFRTFPKHLTKAEVLGLQYQVAARVKAGQPVTLAGNPFAQPLGPTFREFVLFVLASRHVDPHWMEFHKQCAVCFFDYDFIIKFEKLQSEAVQFLDYLNRSAEFTLQKENSKRSNNDTSTETFCSFYGQISVRLIAQLVTKYEKDFKLFEYSPDEYYKCASDYVE
ncbi:carbohydrate sulfotransferase 9-like isoform X2 [Penaeus japonicus]|uniref:carbohydrate sulfotransferase 9-like isoform X2 n=1 Tax=Penaeus japonicus TaxID=27405 RepID=UPI001C70F4BD|nr:carbohydrate sulfotransferase 9-like isoform X2 [Penaeus japonicus]